MNMTSEIWNSLVKSIQSIRKCPPWLKEQANFDFETILQLPALDATSEGQHAAPILEEKIVSADYLNFLQEQIKLNPRGAEWLALLKGRLAALEPFAGKKLLMATFYCKPHSATLRIHPDTQALIHTEMT